ncbi:TPA: hypothetical protein ACIPVM_002554 [Salmonella enterica subsp. diarizonae serovar 50:k:z35]|nr:hypothetical protein [Salmonella enterica]
MVARKKRHSRRIIRSLQRSRLGYFFQKMSDSTEASEYVSVTSDTKSLLIHLVPAKGG